MRKNSGFGSFLITMLTVLSGCHFGWEPKYDEVQAPEEWRNVNIADQKDALTFARFRHDSELQVMLVTSYQDAELQGVNLTTHFGSSTEDPIDLFRAHGFDALSALAAAPADVSIPMEELQIPVELSRHHIAAGTNFPEHAEETGVEEGPYLFPKIVEPTQFQSQVAIRKGLLDYEVELAWVTLESLAEGDSPDSLGLILCNDYTDRDTLLRHLDPSDVESGDGFTTAKSFEGYLPVGNLFVIPRDFRAFTPDLELQLFVNGSLRQRSKMARAVWDVEEILEQSWLRKNQTWEHRGEQVSLFSEEPAVIQERVMLMSGTPPGVVFNEVTVEQKVTGLADFLFFGWGESIPDHAITDYVTDARAAGIYLMPEDRVDIFVQRLGVIQNRVVK